MSNEFALIHFSDGYTLHGIYHGTGDFMLSSLYEREPQDLRNQEDRGPACTCEGEECLIVVSDGVPAWIGKACRNHMNLLSPTSSDEVIYLDGVPIHHAVRFHDSSDNYRRELCKKMPPIDRRYFELVKKIYQNQRDKNVSDDELNKIFTWK